jgi:hypothetical protein
MVGSGPDGEFVASFQAKTSGSCKVNEPYIRYFERDRLEQLRDARQTV